MVLITAPPAGRRDSVSLIVPPPTLNHLHFDKENREKRDLQGNGMFLMTEADSSSWAIMLNDQLPFPFYPNV